MVTDDGGGTKNTPAPWVPYTRAGCDLGATASANRAREHRHRPDRRHDEGVRRRLARVERGAASNAAPAGTAAREPRADRLRRHRDPLRADQAEHLHGQREREGGLAARRAGRLLRLPGPLRGKYVNPAITRPANCTRDVNDSRTGSRSPTSSVSRASRASTGCSRRRRSPTSRRCRRPASRSRTATSRTRTTSTASPARSTRPAGRARPATSSSCTTTTRRSRSSSTGWQTTASTRRTRCSCSPSRRATTSPARSRRRPAATASPSPCNYSRPGGEVNGNLQGLLKTQQGITTPFTIHSDMAPTLYLNGNPARTSAAARRSAAESAHCGRRTRTRATTRTSPLPWPTRWRRRRSTWSPPIRSGRRS